MELQEEFQDYCTGGDKVNELKDFLKNKLNADDFFTAEELLNEILGDEVYESGKQVVSGLSISGQDGKHGVGQAARFTMLLSSKNAKFVELEGFH